MTLMAINEKYFYHHLSKAALVIDRITPDASTMAHAVAMDMQELEVVNSTAIVRIEGPMTYKYDEWSWLFGGVSYQGIAAKMYGIEQMPDIKRVVLLMDTPGGEVTGVDIATAAVANSTKEVIAYVDPCCASAGLWVGSQADKIYSMQGGEIGSLGVQAIQHSIAKQLEDDGVDVNIIRAAISPFKNLNMPYEPLAEEGTRRLQASVDKAGDKFVATVAAGRGVSTDYVLNNFGRGDMLDSDAALDAGLIDGVMTLSELLYKDNPGSSTPKRKRASSTKGKRLSEYQY